jgi:predicted nucleic acid-binding protein
LRILVDTSVWVDFLNGYPSPERNTLAALIKSDEEICTCGVVVAEVFQGLKQEQGRAELGELFRELTYLDTLGIDLYFQSADLYRSLRKKGKTVRSTIDCLIAVLAEEHGCLVLARDRDLEIIFASGLLQTGLWPVDQTAS